jgi:hypothetical protein
MLETKARTNHSNKEIRNSEGTATVFTEYSVIWLKCL